MQNNWKISNNQLTNEGKIVFERNDYAKTAGTVFILTLKVKSNITMADARVSFTGITASTDSADVLTIADTTYLIKAATSSAVTPTAQVTPTSTAQTSRRNNNCSTNYKSGNDYKSRNSISYYTYTNKFSGNTNTN